MRKKKIHLMQDEKFIQDYIEFINSHFDEKEHVFFIKGKVKYINSNFKSNNVMDFSKYKEGVNKFLIIFKEIYIYFVMLFMFYSAKKIIIHGLFNKKNTNFLFFHPWFLRKCNWVIWGGDLYSYKHLKTKINHKIYELKRAFCIKRFGGIVSLTEGDYQLAKEWYNTNAKEYFGMYINPVKKEYLDNIKTKEKKEIYIQIGNSADSSNNHIEIIDLLKKYKNENIKIFAPLSYGDKEYAFEVKKYGEKIFGEKFIAMMEFLKPEEYSEYLGSIDILVFNHKRQQGLGNIYALVYLGKKIFIRSDISSWSFFEDTLDIKLADTLDIDKIDFETLMSNNYAMHNKKRAEETFYSNKYISNLWEKVFRGE